MERVCVDCFAAGTNQAGGAAVARSFVAAFLSLTLLMTPVWGAPTFSLGTILSADRAHVGATIASAGTTVFGGDRLSTEQTGSVQVRVGAARLLLSGGSIATFAQDQASPSATLTLGSATFSTANAKAFSLHVASAVIRPNTDQPTIAYVTVLNPRELVVKSARGSLSVAVEDDVRIIPEGAAYRIVLDTAEPQGPQGAGTSGSGSGTRKGSGAAPIWAAKSKFIWYAIGITAVVTFIAVHEAFESPDRP